jgi:hypothetical protein
MKNPIEKAVLLTIARAVMLLALAQTSMESADQAPPVEQKKLQVFVGEWEYQGSGKDTPLGPGGSFSGREVHRMILDGFFLESRWKDRSDSNYVAQGIVLHWYDALSKNFRDEAFENDGSVTPGTGTVSGNVWTNLGTRKEKGGKSYQTRMTTTFGKEGKTLTTKAEFSEDGGKTWQPWWDLQATRVKE